MKQESRHFAYDPVTEVTYARGEKELSEEDKNRILSLYTEAREKGMIQKMMILTWGDLEYPSIHSRKEALAQEELAIGRNVGLFHFLEGSLKEETNLQFFSMAERKAALNQYLEGEKASTRKSLELVGIPNTDTTVKVPGKASKSIVIFIMEE